MEAKGKVIAVPYSKDDLWTGVYGVLISGGDVIDIVEIHYMNREAEWFAKGDTYEGYIKDDMYLNKLMIKNPESGLIHPLKFNQWKVAKRSKLINTGKEITYQLLDSKFCDGLYLKCCVYCSAYFTGAKKQGSCQECTEKTTPAKIITPKDESTI